VLETTHLRPHLDELSEKMWTLISIDPSFSLKLQQSAKQRLSERLFRDAELAASKKVVSTIRNDQIFWLDSKAQPLTAIENETLHSLQKMLIEIKENLRVFLDHVECHFAFYDKGHFYRKHRDTTEQNNKRIFSFVLYLNENWKADEGGELVGYGPQQEELFLIQPVLGQMILFRSDLEHEVKPTHRERLSLTGWFRQ
jgi:SM-20-related protein